MKNLTIFDSDIKLYSEENVKNLDYRSEVILKIKPTDDFKLFNLVKAKCNFEIFIDYID